MLNNTIIYTISNSPSISPIAAYFFANPSFILRNIIIIIFYHPSNHFILLLLNIEVMINEYKSRQSIDKKIIDFEGKIIILRILFDFLLEAVH